MQTDAPSLNFDRIAINDRGNATDSMAIGYPTHSGFGEKARLQQSQTSSHNKDEDPRPSHDRAMLGKCGFIAKHDLA